MYKGQLCDSCPGGREARCAPYFRDSRTHLGDEDDHGEWVLVWVLPNAWLYWKVSRERLGLNMFEFFKILTVKDQLIDN